MLTVCKGNKFHSFYLFNSLHNLFIFVVEDKSLYFMHETIKLIYFNNGQLL